MRIVTFFFLAFGGLVALDARAQIVPVPANTAVCLSPDETELIRQINEYRQRNARPPIAVSRWLSSVGQWHVWDLVANNPITQTCNLHSWSNARPATWQPVCYTNDHAQANQMWAKPTQVSLGVYTGIGYEIAASRTQPMTPQFAIDLWRNSPAHNGVILNQAPWQSLTWRAVGAGLLNGYAVVWFSDTADPQTMSPCAVTDLVFSNGFEP